MSLLIRHSGDRRQSAGEPRLYRQSEVPLDIAPARLIE
jgi:hypothetical protein